MANESRRVSKKSLAASRPAKVFLVSDSVYRTIFKPMIRMYQRRIADVLTRELGHAGLDVEVAAMSSSARFRPMPAATFAP